MSISYNQRPAFWKVPAYVSNSNGPSSMVTTPTLHPNSIAKKSNARRNSVKKRVHFEDEPVVAEISKVQVGTPAYGEVLRGDIISKIGEYDARDLSHADAQHLFRSAGNEIKIVVHRDNKIAYTQGLSNDSSRCNSTLPPISPDLQLNQTTTPHRAPSPFLPGPGHYEQALQQPVNTLPHTVFPKLNQSGGYVPPSTLSQENSSFSPKPTRDHQQDVAEEQAAIVNQSNQNGFHYRR